MAGFNTVSESLNVYSSGIDRKAKESFGKILCKGILAGMMIAIGASASSVAAHNIENVGLSRLIAGCVFPVGLMMVILLGAELFTGDCMIVVGIINKSINAIKCLTFLLTVYVGNMIGAVAYTFITFLSGQYDYSSGLLGAYSIKVALGKATISFERGVASGILCNILVCAAVLMAVCAKDISGKILCSFFVIMAFVTSGFEHCVANMYYIPAGLICKLNPNYVETAKNVYGITEDKLALLSLKGFFINNLLPVTIGNFLGGALFFVIPLWYLNSKPKENLIDEKEGVADYELSADRI